MPTAPDHYRPRSLFEILDGAVRHYRARFVPMLQPYLPQACLLLLVGAASVGMQATALGSADSAAPPPAMLGFFGLVMVLQLAWWILYILGYGASTLLVAGDLRASPLSPRDAWRAATGRFWGMIGCLVLVIVTSGLATLLFILPGIFVFVRLMLAFQVLLLEEENAGDALPRSWNLMSGNFWKGFVVFLFLWILAVMMSAPSTVLGFAPYFFLDEGGGISNPSGYYGLAALSQVVGVAISLVLAPLASLVFTHFWWDLRVRREGADLVTKLESIAPPPAPKAAS